MSTFALILLGLIVLTLFQAIKRVAFKFVDECSLMQALVRTVEGSIRAFVATQRQAAVLSLRGEIVLYVKDQLDGTLESWGYHLIDLQLNDIAFDEEIMRPMAKVVASNNLKAAAENEGQALLITKTKAAEAEGMAHAVQELADNNLDPSLVYFSMWTEAIKHFAEQGKGNVISLDGSNEGLEKSMQQMLALQHLDRPSGAR